MYLILMTTQSVIVIGLGLLSDSTLLIGLGVLLLLFSWLVAIVTHSESQKARHATATDKQVVYKDLFGSSSE